jgi:hypothetical protein
MTLAYMLRCKFLSTTAAGIKDLYFASPPMTSHGRTLYYGEQPNAIIAKKLNFCYLL